MSVSKIRSVFVFENGNVAVCDQRGEQMPAYQGHRDDVLWLIARDVNSETRRVAIDADRGYLCFNGAAASSTAGWCPGTPLTTDPGGHFVPADDAM